MDPQATAEMRAALARAGIKRAEVARAMKIGGSLFYKILTDERSMPDGFAERFWAYVRPKVEEMAQQMVEDAERQAALLRDAVPDLTEVA